MVTNERPQANGPFWADKIMDLANLSIVVLVFGQFVNAKIEWSAVGLGIVLYGAAVMVSLLLRR